MSKLPICSVKGERVGELSIADDLLELKRGDQVVHDVIVAHQAKIRAGTASTLRKGEVAGSNKKPWKQKGTGRARAGYRQSPVWRGGGITFGPKPRNYSRKITQKSARLAFRRALSDKISSGSVIVIDELSISEPKTKLFAGFLKKLDATGKSLFVLDRLDKNILLASRNVPGVEVTTSREVGTFQLVRHTKVFITKAAMPEIEKRLKADAGSAA